MSQHSIWFDSQPDYQITLGYNREHNIYYGEVLCGISRVYSSYDHLLLNRRLLGAIIAAVESETGLTVPAVASAQLRLDPESDNRLVHYRVLDSNNVDVSEII
ncbi:hypothetical protein [Endozoicomonas sp.]|uniref:hypothetical protein n=1 Tax=Endozoicomonas sp. TaxID=1892382 RepID=UPI00383ADEDE